jgi:hypothetical protein
MPLFLSYFNISSVSSKFPNNPQKSNLIKIRPLGAEFFHEDRKTEKEIYIMKVTVAFRNFAKAPKNALYVLQ